MLLSKRWKLFVLLTTNPLRLVSQLVYSGTLQVRPLTLVVLLFLLLKWLKTLN
eukprot:jgi/Orpsp1_1/1192092/evm.model.d7180000090554.1